MTAPIQNVSVIGAGAWGTALAQLAATARRTVTLYARDAGLAETIMKDRENTTYLPGITLMEDITVTAHVRAAVKNADLVLFVTPLQYMRGMLSEIAPHLPPGVPIIGCSKGIEIATGLLPAGVVGEVAPGHPYGALSGPTFADEAAAGLPSAITLATIDPAGKDWAQALGSQTFRPYLSDDVIGTEVGGALKNVIAIACGVAEGMDLGRNARAALTTRGMAEIRRFGTARGAKVETFLGLSGIGDLMLTCNSISSRNFALGVALGQGQTVAEYQTGRRTVAEGAATARAVAELAEKNNIDMPICRVVDAILQGGLSADAAMRTLLSREIRSEGE